MRGEEEEGIRRRDEWKHDGQREVLALLILFISLFDP